MKIVENTIYLNVRENTRPMLSSKQKMVMDFQGQIRRIDLRPRPNGDWIHLTFHHYRPEDFEECHSDLDSFDLFDRFKRIEQYKRGILSHYVVERNAARIYRTFDKEKSRYVVPSVVYIVEPVAPEREGYRERIDELNMHFILCKVQIKPEGYFIENIYEIKWDDSCTERNILSKCDEEFRKYLSHNKLIEVPREFIQLQQSFQMSCAINLRVKDKRAYIWFAGDFSDKLRFLLGGGLICLDFPNGGLAVVDRCKGRIYAIRPYANGEGSNFVSKMDYIIPLDRNNPDFLDVSIRNCTVCGRLKWSELLPMGKTISNEMIDNRPYMYLSVFSWMDFWGTRFVFAENSQGNIITHIFL